MRGGIYRIVNKLNGDCYVGSTIGFDSRKEQHFVSLRGGYHINRHLQNAFNKYGEYCFEFQVLEGVKNERDLIAREQYYVDSMAPKYNIRKQCDRNTNINCGSDHYSTRLTETTVLKIVKQLKEGLSISTVATQNNTTDSAVVGIKRGLTWKHITSGIPIKSAKKANTAKKLNDDKAQQIKGLLIAKVSISKIAAKYNVSVRTILDIKWGVTWRDTPVLNGDQGQAELPKSNINRRWCNAH